MYLEDKRHAIMQVATGASITISYLHHKEKRTYRPAIPQKSNGHCMHDNSIPTAKKAVGTRASVDFYDDPA